MDPSGGQVDDIDSWGHGWGDPLPTSQSNCEYSYYQIGTYYYVTRRDETYQDAVIATFVVWE